MNRQSILNELRQQSVNAWTDAKNQAFNEAVRNTPVGQQAEGAGLGTGAGGSFGGPTSIFNTTQVLDNFNANWRFITNLIPGGIRFYDEYDPGEGVQPNMINDGWHDMYDGGNALNTNLTQLYENIKEDNIQSSLNIPYTHTQFETDGNLPDTLYNNPPMDGIVKDGTDYFGEGSTYFTNMYPGLFVLAADAISIEEFSICGDIGTDGDAIDTGYIDPVTGYEWTMFLKTNQDTDGSDTCINHIILVPGTGAGKTHLFDETGRFDDDCIQGLTGTNGLIMVVIGTDVESPLNSGDALDISKMILDVAFDNLPVIPPSSGSIVFNGIDPDSGGSYVAAPFSQINTWLPGAADFTVEWFMYKLGDGHPRVFSIGDDTNAKFGVSIEGSGSGMALYVWANEGSGHNWTIGNVDNGWHHFALVRSGGTMTLYKDGSAVGIAQADATNINATPNLDFYIGTDGVTSGDTFNGIITNFRWTNAKVYSAPFTVSTVPLTSLAQTKLLLLGGSIYNPVVDSSGIGNNLDYNNITWTSGSPFI